MSSNGLPFDVTVRAHQPRERLMTAQFLTVQGWWNQAIQNARLGNAAADLNLEGLDPAEQRLMRVKDRWADAIVLLDKKVVIVECKVTARMGPIEGLWLYKRLFKTDPEYRAHWKKPIELWYVHSFEDPVGDRIARDFGCRSVFWAPDWIGDYYKALNHRERRASIVGRSVT